MNKPPPIRGPDRGECQICSRVSDLTDDHVPPKACILPTEMELRTFVGRENGRPRFVQGGIHFRSICEPCNSGLLGIEYDPAFATLCNDVGRLVSSRIQIPQGFNVPARPQRVAKAVVGHLLASIIPNGNGTASPPAPMTDCMRNYALHPSLPLPDQLDLFVWRYEGNEQWILNFVGLMSMKQPGVTVVGSLLKFFPLAFWIVFECPATVRIPFTRLLPDRATPLDRTVDLRITTRGNPRQDWPEHVEPHEMLMLNADVTFRSSVRRRKNGS